MSAPTMVPVDTSKSVMSGDIVQLTTQPSQKGRNVSGRSWKVRPQKRASSLIKTKHNNISTSWQVKQQSRQLQKESKILQKELQEERRLGKVQKRERRLENERRRLEKEYENAQRSAQTLNYTKLSTTLKTMSKKQLRQVKKTRLNTKTGVVEYVPAYAK